MAEKRRMKCFGDPVAAELGLVPVVQVVARGAAALLDRLCPAGSVPTL
jgi:hypothetical protein